MRDKIIHEVLLNPTVLASSLKYQLIAGQKYYELDAEDSKYLSSAITPFISHICSQLYDGNINRLESDDIKKYLMTAFTYCFDKTIELVYNLRVDNANDINFHTDDMLNGMGGDKIPEYLQLKITPIIHLISMIFIETYELALQYSKEIDHNSLSKTLLFGAVGLASELCIRIDLEDTSEMDKYVED